MPKEPEPLLWFALAAEDADHHRVVTRLTHRVLEEATDGFQPRLTVGWRRPTAADSYWKITRATEIARALGLPLRGSFSSKPTELEAVMYRAQLLVWKHLHLHGEPIDVGFMARDTDHKPRLEGAQWAVKSGEWEFDVILVFPHPEVECWAIASFEPRSKAEKDCVKKLARELTFSPTDEPHRLTSKTRAERTDAKRILDELLARRARWDDEWLELDLEKLRSRGQSSGLADFVDQVRALVARLTSERKGSARGG
jgi:hypothetical protein